MHKTIGKRDRRPSGPSIAQLFQLLSVTEWILIGPCLDVPGLNAEARIQRHMARASIELEHRGHMALIEDPAADGGRWDNPYFPKEKSC